MSPVFFYSPILNAEIWGLGDCYNFYNEERFYQGLDDRTI